MFQTPQRKYVKEFSGTELIQPSYLHTVIVLISHNDSSLTVTGNPGWSIELTGPRPQRAELMVEGTARFKDL